MGFLSLLVTSLNGFHSAPVQVEFKRHDVDYFDGRILIDYRVNIDVSADKLRGILSDYEKFTSLSPLIVKSKVSLEKNIPKVTQTLRPCLLGICYSLIKEEKITKDINGRTIATIIPNVGHFKSGMEEWFVESTNQGTILNYHADLTPAFDIPPIIGPLLLKRFIHQELHEIVFKLI